LVATSAPAAAMLDFFFNVSPFNHKSAIKYIALYKRCLLPQVTTLDQGIEFKMSEEYIHLIQ
jgi:hypothetical protein